MKRLSIVVPFKTVKGLVQCRNSFAPTTTICHSKNILTMSLSTTKINYHDMTTIHRHQKHEYLSERRQEQNRWMSTTFNSCNNNIDDILSQLDFPNVLTSFVNGQSLLPRTEDDDILASLETEYINRSPTTGQSLCSVQVLTADEIDRAVKLSYHAYCGEKSVDSIDTEFNNLVTPWSQYTFVERGQILLEMAIAIEQHGEELAILEAIDTGIPITQIKSGHIPVAIQTLKYYAAIAQRGGPTGKIMDVPHAGGHFDSIAYTRKEPLGVCVGIGGWNYPLMTMIWKLSPAICMGNTMLYKPSECTPLTAIHLVHKVWKDIVPPNIIQIILGARTTAERLIQHPLVAKISVTGSTDTGIKVATQAAQQLKKTTLELGGKSPLLIFDDTTLDTAVRIAMEANFINNGQVCSNATRLFVQNTIVEQFIDTLLTRMKSNIQMGNNIDPTTNIGPVMIHPMYPSQHYDRIMGYIQRAKLDNTIQVLFGGNGYEKDGGYYVEPTILLASSSDDAEIVTEEVFGPVMTILSFNTEEEAIQRANASQYGLGAGILTRDVMRAHRVVKQIQAGNVWVNNWNLSPVEMPFGPYKMSGYGQELGEEALEHFSQTKMVYMEMGAVNDEDTSFYRSDK